MFNGAVCGKTSLSSKDCESQFQDFVFHVRGRKRGGGVLNEVNQSDAGKRGKVERSC